MAGNILVINFGSTSTKIAVYNGMQQIDKINYIHERSEIDKCRDFISQVPMRRVIVEKFLNDRNYEKNDIAIVVTRYGQFQQALKGHLRVNKKFIDFATTRTGVTHALYITPIVAWQIFEDKVPIIIADYMRLYNIMPQLLVSGIPSITWDGLCHTENIIAVAGKAAEKIGKDIKDTTFVVGHLGGGVSFACVDGGIIRAAMGDGENAFSPERSGMLPTHRVIEMCFSGQYSQEEMMAWVRKNGGIYAHLGTTDCIDVENRALNGDEKANLIYTAMAYRIAMNLASAAATAGKPIDAVVLSGGLVRSDFIIDIIKRQIGFIAPIICFPGEYEMDYFARVGNDVLNKITEAEFMN